MTEILSTAFSFLIIILISYFLKKKGIFNGDTKRFLSSILINICLPCIIINGFQNFNYDNSLLIAIFLAFGISAFALFIGYLVSRKKNRDGKIIHMMNSCGYNIGIFTIPFVSNFLSSTAVVCALMFDIGNAIFVFGLLASFTGFIVDNDRTNPIPAFIKKLSRNIPFIVYTLMLIMLGLNLKFPAPVYSFTKICASGTSFLAMLLIGLLIEFKINIQEIKEISSALVLRYLISLAASIIIFNLPFFEYELKKALAIAVFSPMSTASVVYAEKLKCKPSLIGAVSSLTIVISIISIIAIIIFV